MGTVSAPVMPQTRDTRLAAHADPALPVSAVETHVSVILLMGDRVYKFKKPVTTAFLDFSTRAARRAVCHREVELNRRFAPDVYLGVTDLVDADGGAFEHAVVMRRMPDGRRLSSLASAGEPLDTDLRAVAERLAAGHRAGERSPAVDAAATADAVAERWRRNAEEMATFAGTVLDRDLLGAVSRLSSRYVQGRLPLFQERIAAGRAVDGHGDLLADDIYCLADGPRILDCIEFDDRLRYGDALADVAFLAMDLERLGRPDLAERFLRHWREVSGDDPPRTLVHHYIAYRAQVRSKVACLRHEQGDPAAAGEASALLRLAADHLRRGAVTLTLVGGLPGTGKSTLAAGLAAARGTTLLRSDEVRHDVTHLGAGEHAAAPYRQGIYGQETTARTYHEMLARAHRLLERGESVVLDASWIDRRWRGLASITAAATHSGIVELECRLPAAVAAARMESRARRGDDISDATARIAEEMGRTADPWPGSHVIDTAAPPPHVLESALRAVDAAETAGTGLAR